MNRKVTILMTSYNGEKFVKKQIESILGQTYSNFKLIIIDDMSTDNTQNLLVEFKDERITLIHNSHNIGCGKSFEKGLGLITSEFVLLCDHDDIWEDNKVEVLLSEVVDNDLVYSDCSLIDENGDVLQDSYKSRNRLIGFDSTNSCIDKICAFNSFILGCSMMFRKETLDYVTPIIDMSHNHDKWIVALISQVGRIKYVDKKLFRYRIHGDNFSIGAKQPLLTKMLSLNKPKSTPLTFSNEAIISLSKNVLFKEKFFGELARDLKLTKIKMVMKYSSFMYLRASNARRLMLIMSYVIKPDFNK